MGPDGAEGCVIGSSFLFFCVSYERRCPWHASRIAIVYASPRQGEEKAPDRKTRKLI
jgi:hypothetical protein